MKQLLQLYFSSLFKPTQFARNFNLAQLPTVAEFIWCSWPFAILQAFYAIGGILLGMGFVAQLERDYGTSYLSSYISLGEFHLKKWMIISTLISVILFPLMSWVYVKFWKMFTLFFAQLFAIGDEDNYEDLVENSVAATLSANTLLCIPLIGAVLKKLAFIIIFFIHLRQRLSFSRYQSVVVLMGPFLLIGILVVLTGMTIGVYLNLI